MSTQVSPFKFLDSYQENDAAIFFWTRNGNPKPLPGTHWRQTLVGLWAFRGLLIILGLNHEVFIGCGFK